MNRRRSLFRALVGLLGLVLVAGVQAQDKPPLRILVGFPPGGSADVMARLVADALRNDFSPLVVENKPGAGGRIALTALKNSKPDGQTVVVLPSGPMVLFPHAYKKLDYDAFKDFTPISLIGHFQFGVVSGPASGARNVQEMLSKVRTDPNSGSYATAGQGTLPHFMGVMMEQATGVPLHHVPFQGSSQGNTALLGSHIGYKFDVVSETAELHRAGKVRIIAVTGPRRDPQVPEVPTLKEAGVNMEATAWFGMYGPANLPPETLKRLESAMTRALRQPAVRAQLTRLGYDPVGSTSAELATTHRADFARWEKPIKATGVSLD